MIIQVKAEGAECPEWAMIELQGELGDGVPGASPEESCGCGSQADSIHLTIGYHQLEGKRVSLKKPFAILETQAGPPAHSTACGGGLCSVCASPARYAVLGVLHHKFLFKTRPRALISKPDGSRQ
eukprot:jgi/Astpho2/2824/e_gw1.00050.215.1_t